MSLNHNETAIKLINSLFNASIITPATLAWSFDFVIVKNMDYEPRLTACRIMNLQMKIDRCLLLFHDLKEIPVFTIHRLCAAFLADVRGAELKETALLVFSFDTVKSEVMRLTHMEASS